MGASIAIWPPHFLDLELCPTVDQPPLCHFLLLLAGKTSKSMFGSHPKQVAETAAHCSNLGIYFFIES